MAGLRQKFQNMFDGFSDYMQQDTRGVEIGVYAASGILFAVAYYKKRPITKFGKASDIPKHFIRDKVPQYGTIKAIEPNAKGPLILVDHKPPLNFLIPSKKLLPIQLPGVSVNANGYSWLQTVAIGRNVEFIPISNSPDNRSAECRVLICCPENKQPMLDATKALLGLGFAKIENIPSKIDDLELKRYYKSLLKVEKYAKHERLGLWSTSLPPKPWPIRKSQDTIKALILSVLPADYRLPELVR